MLLRPFFVKIPLPSTNKPARLHTSLAVTSASCYLTCIKSISTTGMRPRRQFSQRRGRRQKVWRDRISFVKPKQPADMDLLAGRHTANAMGGSKAAGATAAKLQA